METTIIAISAVVYGIVFFIQKAQISKQNELFNKYEKIFSIINIDEIEKYIELQKKSMQLSIKNRETELANNEKFIEERIAEVNTVLHGSKTSLAQSSEISDEIKSILERSQIFVTKLTEINKAEFSEIYMALKLLLESESPELFNKVDGELIKTVKKYDLQKRELINLLQVDK